MWELEKAVLITNNDRVYEKYKDQLQVILLKTYEEVLIKARDMVYDRHQLLTHPHGISERGRGQYERYHADREVH